MTKSILAILTVFALLIPGALLAQTPPTARDDFAIVPLGSPADINVLANDSPGSADFDKAGITFTSPKNGKVENNDPKDDGVLTYTPNSNFSGPDDFTYTVCNQSTTACKPEDNNCCATATVSVFVAKEVSLNVINRKLNVKKMGVLPVSIQSSEDFDITTIDPESLQLQGVSPSKWNMTGKKLNLKFHAQQIIQNLGTVEDGDVVVLVLTGLDAGGVAIAGEDPIMIINKGNKGKKK